MLYCPPKASIMHDIVLCENRFGRSTLQVMGTIPQDGQWSISGGTGELTMARGIVNHKVIEETSISVVYEVEVHAYYIPVNSMVSKCMIYLVCIYVFFVMVIHSICLLYMGAPFGLC
jgi:hypothetical protein